jgi:hypothetical protein
METGESRGRLKEHRQESNIAPGTGSRQIEPKGCLYGRNSRAQESEKEERRNKQEIET